MTRSRLASRLQQDDQAEVFFEAARAEAQRMIDDGDPRGYDELIDTLSRGRKRGGRHYTDQRYRFDARRRAGDTVGPAISRTRIIERDQSRCHICGKVCDEAEIHLDHVVPLARGGDHSEANLRVACARCNRMKGANMPS